MSEVERSESKATSSKDSGVDPGAYTEHARSQEILRMVTAGKRPEVRVAPSGNVERYGPV